MSNLTKIGILLVFFLTTSVMVAQQRPARDKIKTLKVAFITERLDLTSEEAQEFWPIYNAHEADIEGIKRRERVEIRSKMRDFISMPESEASDLLSQLIALEKEKHRLNVAYFERMREVISAKKTFLLIKAEEDFKKRLLKEIQQRRRGGG